MRDARRHIDRGSTLFEPLGATIGERYRDNAGYSSHSDQRRADGVAPHRPRRGRPRAGNPDPEPKPGSSNTHMTAAWIEVDATPRELWSGLALVCLPPRTRIRPTDSLLPSSTDAHRAARRGRGLVAVKQRTGSVFATDRWGVALSNARRR